MAKIWVIGIGPGGPEQMTGEARRCLEECQVIVGYTVYLDLLRESFPEKIYLSTPMRKEEARCRMAFEEAEKGRKTARVGSGDPGVYGMAGLMYEVGVRYPQVQLEVIPGVTAATGGAAVLGAPLIHDFCLISLSDLLTPWETIEKRLRAAAMGDLCVCIYNPSSKKRAGYLRRACEILMEEKSPDTVCGAVTNIGREGEESQVMTLGELSGYEADMFTTVFVGNSQTMELSGAMVTPRGYRL